MPSSLIFAGLVVLWLLILVPAVARHQQEVARPSLAALSGRVLARPPRRHRTEEVDDVHDTDPAPTTRTATQVAGHDARDDRDGARGYRAGVDGRGYDGRGHDDRGHDDRGHDDYGYDDRGHDDRGHDDRGHDDRGHDDYGYDPGHHDRGYDPGHRGYRRVDGGADPDERSRGDHIGYDDRWERPGPRYRPGRGGFDPDAAALTARARYAFRQRVVLGMLIAVALTALLALLITPALWWVHGAVDVALVGYLCYLRRQVRLEEAIRERRAARIAGAHHARAAEDPELDGWARRDRAAAREDAAAEDDPDIDPDIDDDHDLVDRVSGTGEPVGPLVVRGQDAPALPRLAPVPPPPLPAGTAVVDSDLEDPDLHDLTGPDHRRAAG